MTAACAAAANVVQLFLMLFLLLLLLNSLYCFEYHHGEYLVQRVHAASLQPLGDSNAGVGETKLVQDVVHPVRLYLTSGPAYEADGGLQVPSVALKLTPVIL